nr:hypothetical protein [Candidatus Aminicenantes bacterium]NIM78068.1 hypothetical protein [Candidatus Aminicenantes bacterium]NIN17388.1 hypothetical protein [Candidatus Aminicenantes bacterium]NIN41281.1 hypothetical protein [Candidatus Aminicenantes bacterium]NIN84054.1 hypothetical protein [Candidatus Aminicenantes bacterium]
FRTAAIELKEWTKIGTEIAEVGHLSLEDKKEGIFNLILAETEGDTYFRIDEDGAGCIAVSKPHLLFGFLSYLLDCLVDNDVETVREGRFFNTAFQWQRSSYDFFLNQEGRIQRNMDKETYIRHLAALGFTHLEVNGLAFPMALETGPKGEAYHMFYTYCPALDQFVYSQLNKGIYPYYYLSANLSNLKTNARLAVKYGLVPGLLCFEPRSLPEAFFSRYPMLRGARVDHPFRSFKPRYNMTIAHPKVKEHYREMLTKLMREVPELGFISIWTNDSGAGFEYTKSLYVGRNGGAYLIREWKDDEEIARAAGENALQFFYLLRDAGRKINPGFRVITRMESFYGEHDIIWKGLEDQVDVETTSLIAKGWEMPYSHPRYPESTSINGGTVYQCQFDPKENVLMKELETRDSCSHFYFAAGPHAMFAPLLGIPYPSLTYQRLKLLYENGVRFLAHSGGTFPPGLVPFNVNHEISRVFQFNPGMNIRQEIEKIARIWTGNVFLQELQKAWQFTEEAVLAFPNITPLYSTMGFVWYRLWVRPLVPNIEAIDREERAYYEDFMCTTPHNPNNVDLSRDVLFQLTTPEKCRKDVERIDINLWKPLDQAIEILSRIRSEARNQLGNVNVIEDQYIRLNALRCWFMTQRNAAAWIAGVHGFLDAENDPEKEKNRELLKNAMKKEIKNSKQLLELLASGIEFMAVTDIGETPLIHGNNLKDLLQKRITLMEAHMKDEPFIDPLYIEKNAGKVLL